MYPCRFIKDRKFMIDINAEDQFYMQKALQQAQIAAEHDEVPVGAVIIFQNQIIAKAHNQVEMLKDPTAHAEMIAITQACNALSAKWLTDCCLYVTVEPCSMCAGALVLARINRLCYGTRDLKTGACGSVVNLAQHNALNHQVEVREGLFRDDCGALMTNFFEKKRAAGKKVKIMPDKKSEMF